MIFRHVFPFVFLSISILSYTEKTLGQGETILLPIEENERWGFIDTKGGVIIAPQFISVGSFSEGLATVQLESGGVSELPNGKKEYKPSRFGFVNTKGEIVLKLPYDGVGDFVEGMAPVRIGDRYDDKYYYPGKYGFINRGGELVVDAQYDAVANSFSEGLSPFMIGKKWGYLDKSRRIVITPEFDGVNPFSEGLASVKKGGEYGYIDHTGQLVIKPQFARGRSFHNGLASIQIKQYGNFGYVDKTGQMVIQPRFNSASDFVNEKAFVQISVNKSTKDLCIDKKGKEFDSKECLDTSQVFPVVKDLNGKKVFVDETGKVLFEKKWDYFKGFYHGVALVFNNAKGKYWCGLYVPGWVYITDACFDWGYIDENGKYIWKTPGLN